MKKKNLLLILWIIFGFIFIKSIDSILSFGIHLIYFLLVETNLPSKVVAPTILIISLILYSFTTLILLKTINTKSTISSIYLTKFPKKLTIVLGVVAIGLPPITNKLFGIYSEYITQNKDILYSEYLELYGWFTAGLGLTKWLILVVLLIVFLIKLNKLENNTSMK